MKHIFKFSILVFWLFLNQNMYAQSVPQGMRYQAVARDLSGNPLKNTYISIRIGIRSGDANGDLVYRETHHVTTDNGGQFAITVGGGRVELGDFTSIPWGSAEMWMTVALDEQGGDNFKTLTASQLWTVPYAFHAGTAETLSSLETAGQANKGCGATGIPFWTNLGNTNVSDTCHFIGTVYAVDFVMKTNNIERMRITKDGKIVISGFLEVEDLHVKHDADIDHNLNVDNDTHLGHDLNVDNDAGIGNNLSVGMDAAVGRNMSVAKDLSVGSRVVVNAGVSGNDQSINSYPVLVQGSNQGIAIKVNGSRSTANNFVSFWDVAGGMQGRIEGQTSSELHNSFDYIWYQTMNSLNAAFASAIIVADIAGVDDADAAVVEGTELALAVAEWVKVNVEMDNNVGVAFESGNGDYAEWLEKANPVDDYQFGEVVGVRGGKISKRTDRADHIMVVSKNPIVLGNMPPAEHQGNFEKIAFMGQVPVRVVGKVAAGDYLLASGRNDGMAIAVSPARMRTEDYTRIVGVAWQASDNPLGGLVNAAIGINTNDVANRVAQQQRELDALKQQINQLYVRAGLPAPNAVQPGGPNQPVSNNDQPVLEKPALSKAQVDQWLDAHRHIFETWMNRTRAELEQQGADIHKYPEVAAIYADPVQYLKDQNDKGYLRDMLAELMKH